MTNKKPMSDPETFVNVRTKVYEHVINGKLIRTNLTEDDLQNPKFWGLRSVDAWAHAIYMGIG